MAQKRVPLFDTTEDQTLRIQKDLACKIGFNEAVVLMQLEYLISISNKEIDGNLWTYQTLEELKEKSFPWWSITTISRALKSLKDQDIIFISNFNKQQRDRTQWFSLDFCKIKELGIKLNDKISILQNEKWKQGDIIMKDEEPPEEQKAPELAPEPVTESPSISQDEKPILQIEKPILQIETTLPKTPTKNSNKESDDEDSSHVHEREEKVAAIMALYQNNINISESPLTTQEMLSDEFLRLPLLWWQEAVKIATDNGVRKWSYVRGILRRSALAHLSPLAAGSPGVNGSGPGHRSQVAEDSTSLFPAYDPDQPEPEIYEPAPEEKILAEFKAAARLKMSAAAWEAHVAPLVYLDHPGDKIRLACGARAKEWLDDYRLSNILDPIALRLNPEGGFEYVSVT